MKPLTTFESAIIGFFLGVIASTYLAFVTSTGGAVGKLLHCISLRPLLDQIGLPENMLWIGGFIFTILVFIIYGAIIGLLFKLKGTKKTVMSATAVIALLFIGIFVEQYSMPTSADPFAIAIPQTASVISSIPKPTPQYFGTEAYGDLNADGKDDVAFIISRDDEERGTLYYLTAALATTTGKSGTNLIFLGEKIQALSLSINQDLITVSYDDASKKGTTTLNYTYAKIVDQKLVKVTDTSTTTASN
jgi:hypothetical protein